MSRRGGRRFFTIVRVLLHVVFVTRLAIALVASTRVDLNGSWRFRIDRNEEGEAQGWDTTLPPGTEVVRVRTPGILANTTTMRASRGTSAHWN
jgi:hypothetical protein